MYSSEGPKIPVSGAAAGVGGWYGAAVFRGLVLAAVAALGFAASSTAAAPAPAPTFVVTGHGWGHGVGMSQWGAYGYALHGWDATRILAHYYPGTTLGDDSPTLVHVLLVEGKPSTTLGSAAPWHVVDASGAKLRLPAGQITLPASLSLRGKQLVSPLTVKPGTAPLEVGGHPYRGTLTVTAAGSALDIVNAVPLEAYLPGVVGEEVPSSWPQAALEAQAIAARSYALHQIASAAPGSAFELYADGRDQVYGGIDAESPPVTQAVAATARKVVLYDGHVALTYFSSSSGGRTADAADVVGFAVPYLVSVPDPYDTYSPNHDWPPLTLSARAAGKALGLHAPLLNVELQAAPDGRVVSVTATTAKGQVTLTGAQVRDDLELRSSWFEISVPQAAGPQDLPVGPDGLPLPQAA